MVVEFECRTRLPVDVQEAFDRSRSIDLHLSSPPDSFVDEQVRGPFKSFWHEHRFVATGDGTDMIDRVAFTAPLGVLGRLAEVVLRPYLQRLIEQRNATPARGIRAVARIR